MPVRSPKIPAALNHPSPSPAGGWSVLGLSVLVLKPSPWHPQTPPGGGRPSRPCRFVWQCGLFVRVLALLGGGSRTVPPPPTNWSDTHPPTVDFDIVDAVKIIPTNLSLAENASSWSGRPAEPLPQAINQADDLSPGRLGALYDGRTCDRQTRPETDSLTWGGD